jgi:hypothetical protein
MVSTGWFARANQNLPDVRALRFQSISLGVLMLSGGSAETYLRSARNGAIAGAEEAMVYYFQSDRWHRMQ